MTESSKEKDFGPKKRESGEDCGEGRTDDGYTDEGDGRENSLDSCSGCVGELERDGERKERVQGQSIILILSLLFLEY